MEAGGYAHQRAPHLQGYIEFKTAINKFELIRKIGVPCYVTLRMGTQQEAIDYCRKNDTRQNGPWEYGQRDRYRTGRHARARG